MFASRSARGFYDSAIHITMPDDVVEITAEEHAELLMQQGEGKVIAWTDNGYPYAVDPLPASPEELIGIERAWRDSHLSATDSVVTRHRDEVEGGIPTTISVEQYAELQGYRRQLRNWPESGEFPLSEHRPRIPDWLASQLA